MSLYHRARTYAAKLASTKLLADIALLKSLWLLAAPVRPMIGFALLLMFVVISAGLVRPYIMKVAIDDYIMVKNLDGLPTLFILYVTTIIAGVFFSFGENLLLQKAGQKIIQAVREKVFRYIINQRISSLEKQPLGHLVTNVTNDTDAVRDLYSDVLIAFASDSVTLVGIVLAMLVMNWKLALVSFTIIPFMVVLVLGYQKYARRAYRSVREKTAAVNSFVQERLSGISVIKAFGAFSNSEKDFQQPNDGYLQAGLAEVRTFAAFRPLVEVVYIAAVLLVLWSGGWQARAGGIEIGVIVAFLRYIEKFFGPIKDLAEKYSLLQSALAAAERIQPMLSEPEQPLPQAAPVQRFPAAAIEFDDVWFAYEDDVWVLSGVTFKVPAGKFFGIVGSSGSGKTSLLNLLLRFYEPQRGRILIDGTDIKEIPLPTLRHRIATVFQDVHIFKGSVAENISLYNSHISAEKIRAAAQAAHLDYFISKLPQGYDTQAGYLGSALSAGQRQLLSFARALVTEADILILDEATSSIDSHTENKVQHTVINAAANRTLLVVAHRLSTVKEADCILVMYRGKISERGTHEQLMELGMQYARLYNSQ